VPRSASPAESFAASMLRWTLGMKIEFVVFIVLVFVHIKHKHAFVSIF